jgi:hypothetical protein
MNDSGEDWDLEISSGVSKSAQWKAHTTESNSQNHGFSTPEKQFGRGRGRARNPSYNSPASNGSGSTSWRSLGNGQDSDNGWPRRPRGEFNSGFSSTKDQWAAQSDRFGSRDRDSGVSGSRQGDRDVLRIEVSSRDVGKIIGKLNHSSRLNDRVS